jgi:hypothetical protein
VSMFQESTLVLTTSCRLLRRWWRLRRWPRPATGRRRWWPLVNSGYVPPSPTLRLTCSYGNGKVALDACSEGSLCSRLWGIIPMVPKVCLSVSGCGFHLSKLYALPGVWGISYQFAFVTVSILKLSGICFASSMKISIMEVILALKTALLQV